MGRLFIASAREQRRRVSEHAGPALRPNPKGYEEQKERGGEGRGEGSAEKGA